MHYTRILRYNTKNYTSSSFASIIMSYMVRNNYKYITSMVGQNISVLVDEAHFDNVNKFKMEQEEIVKLKKTAIKINQTKDFTYISDHLVKLLNEYYPDQYSTAENTNQFQHNGVVYTLNRVFISGSRTSDGSRILLTASDKSVVIILDSKFNLTLRLNLNQSKNEEFPVTGIDILRRIGLASFTGEMFDKLIAEYKIVINK